MVATRREWLGLAVLALPCALYAMDVTVLDLAVPSLSAALMPSGTELLWILDIYGFLVAGSLITMGTLGDRIGRRRLLLVGAAAFGAFSVLAAFSTSAGMLIVARALLGVAGATVAPSTLSLIRSMFLDPRQRATAIGIWITSYSAGSAIGPLVGGILLERFWWGAVFLPSVPAMLLLFIAGPRLLPEYRVPGAGRPDLASAGLSLLAVLGLIYGLKQTAARGAELPALAALVVGLLAGVAFVQQQRRLAEPLVDLALFRARRFRTALTAYLLASFVAFAAYIFVGQYLQLVLGLSPLLAGVWTLPFPAGFIAGSNLSPLCARVVGASRTMVAGLGLAAGGFILVSQVGGPSTLPVLAIGTLALSIGLAPVVTLGTDLMIGAAPPERAGAASAISETASELGAALGVAIMGTVGTAIYRHAINDRLAGLLPPAALETARETLGSARALAGELPAAVGARLLDTSVDAFTAALSATATICAAIVVVAALLTASFLDDESGV